MSGFDYSRMAGTATRLMERFQQGAVVLTRAETEEPDPATPWEPGAATETTFALKATVKGVSDQYVDGTTILATDLEVTCAVFGAAPLPSDKLTIDGRPVTVVRVMTVPAAGTPVAHKFIVRG